VTARGFDRFPAREGFEQLTDKRRLPDIGSKTTNTNNHWTAHTQ
jgi:hypothetical protein